MPLRPQAETGRQTLAQHRESRANQTWMQHHLLQSQCQSEREACNASAQWQVGTHQRQLQVLLQRLASQWHQRPVLARMPQRGLCQRALRLRLRREGGGPNQARRLGGTAACSVHTECRRRRTERRSTATQRRRGAECWSSRTATACEAHKARAVTGHEGVERAATWSRYLQQKESGGATHRKQLVRALCRKLAEPQLTSP